MAAGLGFKDFTTGEVLTAADVDGYLMQGVLVFTNAAARDAAITAPQEGQTCYLKSTDAVMTYSGSTWVAVGGGSSPLTTKGDLYTFSTVDARLPVGTNGQVLTADSNEATGLKFATPAAGGGMTSIASGAFTATSTLDLTSISGSFKDLQFVARNVAPVSDTSLRLRFNNLSTSIYNAITITNINGTAATAAYTAEAQFILTAATGQSPLVGPLIITIFDYANATSHKNVVVEFTHLNNGGQICQMFLSGTIRTNNALDRLTLSLGTGNFTAGGSYNLYGVN